VKLAPNEKSNGGGARANLRKLLQYYVRNFPVDRGKSRAISFLWKPLSADLHAPLEAELSQANVRVICHLNQMIQRQLYFWGSYEKYYCAHWIRFARAANTIFDVGANVGLYSLLAASTNPAAEIHAFEPTAAVIEVLRSNIALNGFRNITANNCGIGKDSGEGFLRECRGMDDTNEGMNYIAHDSVHPEATDRPVAIVSLDDYCVANGIKRIDLLKMDIEGGEYDALSGARKLLEANSIGCLFVEFMGWAAERSNHSTADLKRVLLEAGYLLFRLGKNGFLPVEAEVVPDSENVIAFAPDFEFSLVTPFITCK
jgi:FkbM family methyltransferase